MKNFFKASLAVIALVVMMGVTQSAYADPVTYSTTGTFTGPGAAGSVLNVPGGGTITFTGVVNEVADPTSVPAGWTFANFGTFVTAGGPMMGTVGAGTTFTLTIMQTIPGAGSGAIVGTLTGTLTTTGSTIFLNYGNPEVPGPGTIGMPGSTLIGTHLYDIFNTSIAEPGAVPTRQRGRITETPIPEPATMVLLGTGLAGVAGAARRRRKARR